HHHTRNPAGGASIDSLTIIPVRVTPGPIAALLRAADMLVYDVGAAPFHPVAAIGAVFTIIPHVVVVVIPVVDTDLDHRLSLQTGRYRNRGRHNERRGQCQGTEKSILALHNRKTSLSH